MPAFMSKVQAGGTYRYLPAYTDIAGFCYCFLVLAQNCICHSIHVVSAIKVVTHIYLIKKIICFAEN